MDLWDGSNVCGVVQARNAATGMRCLVQGTNPIFLSTARWSRDLLTQPDFHSAYAGGQAMRSDVGATAVGNDEVIWVGNARFHAGNGSSSNLNTTIFFGPVVHEDTQEYCDFLLALPIFKEVGVTPASTTEFLRLTQQLYELGMWGWTEGGYPPIGAKPIFNFVMHMDECWDGNTIASYVGTAANNFSAASFVSATPSTYSNWSAPWAGVMNFNDTLGINCDSDPAIIGEVTIETLFEKDNDTSTEYLWDGRADGGVWMLMKYQSFDINWNNQNRFNLTDGMSIGAKYHMVATSKSSTNTSKIYLGDPFGSVLTNIGTASGNMTRVGQDWKVGVRYTNVSHFDGEMAMHRVWNFTMDDTQANILYLHELGQMNTGIF